MDEIDLGRGASVWVADGGYRFTQDSVLLANLAPAGTRDRVLDLGCGMGIVGLLLLLKRGVREVVGLDIDSSACELARENAAKCGVDGRYRAVCRDVRGAEEELGHGGFDKVVCNPPYFSFDDGDGGGRHASSKREGEAVLEDFVTAGAKCLRFGGDFSLVMRADRLADAVCAMRAATLEPKKLCMIYPRADKPASAFVLTARKGGKTGLTVSCLVTEGEDGKPSREMEELLK